MQRELAAAPPQGFRKAIPVAVKLDVVIRQDGRCKTCGERLGELAGTQFDHVPAIQLRTWDAEAEDTVPPSNDPGSIFAKHKDCHKAKTSGDKAHIKIGTDIHEIARTRRLTKREEEFRRKLLSKASDDEPDTQLVRKKKWPKRSFATSKRHAKHSTRSEESRPADHGSGRNY